MRAALGFRDHSGWAVAVAIAIDARGAPILLARERITICPAHLPRQPYHAVAEQGMAQETIRAVEEAALKMAGAEVDAMLRSLIAIGHEPLAAGIGEAAGAIPGSLDAILRTHTLLHAAEGRLFREAIAEAAASRGLRVHRFLQRDAFAMAAGAMNMTAAVVESQLSALGKLAGPPWRKDHREAAAGALIALSG